MYRITSVQIGLGHPLYEYCTGVTQAANNLYNTTIFHERQCFFGLRKDPDKRYPLENQVINRIRDNLPAMNAPRLKKDGTPKKTRASDAKEGSDEQKTGKGKKKDKKKKGGPKFEMPTAQKTFLEPGFLCTLFQTTKDPDYTDPRLGRQTAQGVVEEAAGQFPNYFASIKKYRTDSSSYTGMPKPPGYLKKGGMHTATLSNIECEIRSCEDIERDNQRRSAARQYRTGLKAKGRKKKQDGENQNIEEPDLLPADHAFLKFPKTNILCDLGPIGNLNLEHQRLMEVKITPHNGTFTISVTLDDHMEKKTFKEQRDARKNRKAEKEQGVPPLPEGVPLRACSIDMGVDNLMAVTNNIGAECLLFKGKACKSINQGYNKKIAKIMSEQTTGTTNKFVPTPEYYQITQQRNNRISDFMHKSAKTLLTWCVEHEINTIVIGKNPLWKQKSKMTAKNNQNFVQIPFAKLTGIITYLAKREGIRVIEQEESYTSRASFLDRDPMPEYGKEGKEKPVFSGKRGPTEYNGHPKPPRKGAKTQNGAFRGLYVSKDGTVINSDLNGSGNIGRKAFPDMYNEGIGIPPDFKKYRIIRFPDEEHVEANRAKQRASYAASHPMTIQDDKGRIHHIGRTTLKRRRRKVAAGKKVSLLG